MADEGSFREGILLQPQPALDHRPAFSRSPRKRRPASRSLPGTFGEELARMFSGFSEGAMDHRRLFRTRKRTRIGHQRHHAVQQATRVQASERMTLQGRAWWVMGRQCAACMPMESESQVPDRRSIN